jgi:hypothetical protein
MYDQRCDNDLMLSPVILTRHGCYCWPAALENAEYRRQACRATYIPYKIVETLAKAPEVTLPHQ